MNNQKKIAVTIGDPNSIGAEIAIKAINSNCVDTNKVILFANQEILDFYKLKLKNNVEIVNIDFDINKISVGENSKYGGEFAYKTLELILSNIQKYNLKSIVTAPVSKFALNLAGHNYSGQTEILQKFIGNEKQKAQMLFVAKDFRVMLLTRHIPISTISQNITPQLINHSISQLNDELQKYYKIEKPKIALCALNPHAGENGMLGKEEIDIFETAINDLRKNNIDISNPYPADALFKKAGHFYLKNEKQPYDCYVSAYHDQGLCAIKPLAQEECVNTTIGLNILRTSPCHGTAFDIAGKNIADATSMICALKDADI